MELREAVEAGIPGTKLSRIHRPNGKKMDRPEM
jgi:hypothetical protein